MCTLRPLGSIPVKGLLGYYGSVRLPHLPCSVMSSRCSVEAIALGNTGLSGSSTVLSARAVSFHPGKPIGSSLVVLPHGGRLRLIRKVGRLALGVTRPFRVRLRYGSCVRLPRLHRRDYSLAMLGCLHGERAITMIISFQTMRAVRLFLTHRITLIPRIIKAGSRYQVLGGRFMYFLTPRT